MRVSYTVADRNAGISRDIYKIYNISLGWGKRVFSFSGSSSK